MQISIGGKPNEKQKLFLKSTARFTAYGGARGGGKSWGVRSKAILLAARYQGIRMLILRRTFPELNENHVRPLKKLLNVKKGKVQTGRIGYNGTDKAFEFPNGSVIKLGYLDNDSDVDQYQGQEYDIIFMDEGTHFSEYMFNILKACLRGANNFPKRMYITCNPGGVGHVWVKRLFVDKEYRADENAADYCFISARVYDNVNLLETDKGYVQMLESLPEGLKRAWLHGDWNVFEGQYFSEFCEDIHVVQPHALPEHWKRYTAMDYGLDMFAHYEIRVDEEKNVYVVGEIYESGQIVSVAAEKMKERYGQNISRYTHYAPPDLWNKQQITGRSTADIFFENGIRLVKSNNDRTAGWLAIHELLKVKTDKSKEGRKTARLKIFSSCYNLIRTLPLLQTNPHNPSDTMNEPHEITHAPDALRYFAIAHTLPAQGLKDKGWERPAALVIRNNNYNEENEYLNG